jgi:hypothetical protein
MKTKTTKQVKGWDKIKVPDVIIDPSIDEDKIDFPEKLAMANKMLETAILPELKQPGSSE